MPHSLTTTASFAMKNTVLGLLLVGLHSHLASGLPQHVLAGTNKRLSLRPQQQLNVTINIAYSPFHDSSAGHCVTEDFGCEQGYCWRKVSSVSYSSRGNRCHRDADTCVSVRALETGAGEEISMATLPYVRLLLIAPWLQLRAR